MKSIEFVRTFLESFASSVDELDKRQVWQQQQAWRREFSQAVHKKTGRWIYRGIDWHTFSYGFQKAYSGLRAQRTYDDIVSSADYFVWGGVPLYGFSCQGPLPKSVHFRSCLEENRWAYDLYVTARDLSWTFVMTHELELAPAFFARSDRTVALPDVNVLNFPDE